MNRRSLIRNLIGIGAGSYLFAGQKVPVAFKENQETFILKSESRLVLLDVSVRNRQGGLVAGLARESFHVFEDGRPQKLSVFDQVDQPVTLGILVDESQSMSNKRSAVLVAAESLIAESNQRDEIFVLNFNEHVTPGLASPQMFSDDLNELRAALYRGVPRGRTALNDAVFAGLKQLESGKRERKTLVVISDGGDNNSDRTSQQTIDALERSSATVYTIGLLDINDRERNPGFLRRLARVSGGDFFQPQETGQMASICHRIAQDIRTRYTLGYVPISGKTALRKIRVEVAAPNHSGLNARTRTIYRYDDQN